MSKSERMIRGIYLLVTAVLMTGLCYSQNTDIQIVNLSIHDGLSQSQVSCILQDSKGFIWIGTQDGLNKYDGYHFKIYRHDPYDSCSISSNSINCIIESSNNNLWIGTRFGLNKYIRSKAKFRNYYHNDSSINSLSNNTIHGIIEDSDGILWVKTSSNLDKFNTKTNYFEHFEFYQDPFNLKSDHLNYPIILDNDNTIWFGTKDGLQKFDIHTQQCKSFFHVEGDTLSISSNDIRSIFEYDKKNLFIGTSNGLNRFNKKDKTFTRYLLKEGQNQNTKDIKIINSIQEDEKGRIWLGSGAGLLFFEPNLKKTGFNSILHINKSGLHNKKVSVIAKDFSNILWIGTWNYDEKGLYKIIIDNRKFKLYSSNQYDSPKFSGYDILSISMDKDSNLLLGTRGNGLNIYNMDDQSVQIFTKNSTNKSLPDNTINEILTLSNQDIAVGTSKGVVIFRNKINDFVSLQDYYSLPTNKLFYNNTVNSLIEDSEQNLWIGTNQGLHHVNNGFSKSYYHKPDREGGMVSNEIFCLLEDRKKHIWIGTSNGLNVYNPEINEFKIFRKTPGRASQLSNNIILSLFEDNFGTIWIGTESGLNKYNRKTEQFEFYTQKDGFRNDYIFGILEDKAHNLWISTNRGLSKFDPATNFVKNYDIYDGLQAYEFNKGACYSAPNGKLFFGGPAGFNVFYPDSIHKNNAIPKLSFTSVEIINKNATTEKLYHVPETLTVQHRDYLFTIEFAALEFSNPDRNHYAYMLEGFDEDWIKTGTKNWATYSQIPPGTYRFRVKGSNSDLVWNNKGISMTIVKEPSLFNNYWAYFIYAVTGISVIVLLIQYRTKSLRKTNQILKEKQITAREISRQKEELSIKNKSITDSMTYAQRIIQAMMPSSKILLKHFTDSFILYLPKEIVSGDFYWIAERNNKVFVAAVDCTGHGIPGAFMSIIGFDLLRNIINVKGVEDPAEVLLQLNAGVAETFRDAEDMTVSDGMDLAFCVIDKKNNKLEYAGAFNPLYLIRDNNIIDFKGDRFSVGLASQNEKQVFQKHSIKLEKDDVIYLFSDGFADQFGGPKSKKYKYRRFRHLLLTIHKFPFTEQKNTLLRSFSAWKGNLEQVDDILVIGIKPN